MGLGRQVSTSSTLLTFAGWAARNGYRVGEHPKYGGVAPVHTKGSWHYDGLAVDVNYGPPGTSATERDKLLKALKVAESMGLGVIFARDGYVGSAASHRGHLHVDVGPTSNYGRGLVPVKAGDLVVWKLQPIVRATQDNLWGPDTDHRLAAVRLASKFHGRKGDVATLQRILGVKADGVRGPVTNAAHDRAVAAIQRVLGVKADGLWGPKTDAAFLAARRRYYKRGRWPCPVTRHGTWHP